MTPSAQRFATWFGLHGERVGVVDAASSARARRRVRRGLVIRVLVTCFFLVMAVVCLVQSQTVAALALTAGAVIEFGSVLLWRRILKQMTGGATG